MPEVYLYFEGNQIFLVTPITFKDGKFLGLTTTPGDENDIKQYNKWYKYDKDGNVYESLKSNKIIFNLNDR